MLQIGFELLFRSVWGWLLATSLTAAIRERILWPTLLLLFALGVPIFFFRADGGSSSALNFYIGGLMLGASAFLCLPFDRDKKTLTARRQSVLKPGVKILLFAIGIKILELVFVLSSLKPIGNGASYDEMGRPLLAPQSEVFLGFNAAESYLSLRGEGPWNLGAFGQLCLFTSLFWGVLLPALMVLMIAWKTKTSGEPRSRLGFLCFTLWAMIIVGQGAALYLNFALGWNL